MKTIYHMLILMGSVLFTSLAQGQVVLEALEGFTPSARCLELVKDRNYGNGTHNFIYCAVMGPNGKKWLNLNLGAEYAKESSPHFNPEAVPENNNDWKASGSLFQYGRKADGHELISAYVIENGRWKVQRQFPTITSPVDAINSPQNYVSHNGAHLNSWTNASNSILLNNWQTVTNPCPDGYHVMTANDFYHLFPNTNFINKTQGVGGFDRFYNHNYPELIFFAGAMTHKNGYLSVNDVNGVRAGAWVSVDIGTLHIAGCCGVNSVGWHSCEFNPDSYGFDLGYGTPAWLDTDYEGLMHIHGDEWPLIVRNPLVSVGSLPVRCVEN